MAIANKIYEVNQCYIMSLLQLIMCQVKCAQISKSDKHFDGVGLSVWCRTWWLMSDLVADVGPGG